MVIRNVTVLAPYDSPNTDGIDPGTGSLPILSSYNNFFLKKKQEEEGRANILFNHIVLNNKGAR